MILVVNATNENFVSDEKYHTLIFAGGNFTEEGFRKWVNDRWQVDGLNRQLSLEELALYAEAGGFHCYQLLNVHKFDLPEFREAQMHQVQESSSMRSNGKVEASPRQDQNK